MNISKDKILWKGKHVSGFVEIAVETEPGKIEFFLVDKRMKKPVLDKNACYVCGGIVSFIDRGVPLCEDCERKQERLVEKRPVLMEVERKWNEDDPLSVIF